MLDEPVRDLLEALAADAKRGDDLPWIVAWGPRGGGKKTVAMRLAACAGRPLVAVDPSAVDKTALGETLRRAHRDARWLGAWLYVGPLAGELVAHEGRELFHALGEAQVPLVLGVEALQPPRLRSPHPLVEVGLLPPSHPGRVELWRRTLDGAASAELDIEALARGYKLTPGEIGAAAREARVVAGARGCDDRLVRACVERSLRNELGDLARRLDVSTTWDDLVLARGRRGARARAHPPQALRGAGLPSLELRRAHRLRPRPHRPLLGAARHRQDAAWPD